MVSSTIKIITIVLVVVYLTVCAIVGIKKNKTNTSVREYFISNKNVGLFFLFFTCFASFCGSGNFIGFAGRTAMYGAAAYWNFLGDILLGYIAFTVFLAPYLSKFDYYTMPHYIASYLAGGDMTVRRLGGVCAAIGNVAITGMQIMGMTYMLYAVLEVNFYVALIIAGGIVVFYTVFGGMDAVVFTDSFQGMLQLFVVVFVIIFSFRLIDFDVPWLFQEVNKVDPQLTTVWGTYGWKKCISNFLTGFFGSLTNPIMWNRCFIAKDVDTAKTAFRLSTVLSIVATFLVMSIGFLARVYNNDVGDQATVWLIINKFPAWFTPLAVIGLMGAIMSTADTHLNSGIANIVCDCIDPNEKMSVEQTLRVSKIAGLNAGALAILGAAVAPSLLDLSYLGLVIVGGTLFPVFIIGYVLRDKTSKEFRSNMSIKAARYGILIGLVVTTAFQLVPSLANVIGGGIIPGMITTTIVILILNKVFKPEYPIVSENV